jgi:hypothetical protein
LSKIEFNVNYYRFALNFSLTYQPFYLTGLNDGGRRKINLKGMIRSAAKERINIDFGGSAIAIAILH